MDTILKIFLLLTASRCALAVCFAGCDNSLPCSEVYSCLLNKCASVTEKDLPDKCKCYVKCRDEFDSLKRRPSNCIFLQRLQTCFQNGGCSVSNVPELQKFKQECSTCAPKQCKQDKCVEKLICLTNITQGGCTTAADVQAVMNTTSETMHNAWFLPENCTCVSKCAYPLLRYVPSCMGYEMVSRCAFDNYCPVNIKKTKLAACDCEFGCRSELQKAKATTNEEEKCKAKKAFGQCAANIGCKRDQGYISSIICEIPPANDSPYFGSKILLPIMIVCTILLAFIDVNVIMA